MRVLLGSWIVEEIGTALASSDGADEKTGLGYTDSSFDIYSEGQPEVSLLVPWIGEEIVTSLDSPDGADEENWWRNYYNTALAAFRENRFSLVYKNIFV